MTWVSTHQLQSFQPQSNILLCQVNFFLVCVCVCVCMCVHVCVHVCVCVCVWYYLSHYWPVVFHCLTWWEVVCDPERYASGSRCLLFDDVNTDDVNTDDVFSNSPSLAIAIYSSLKSGYRWLDIAKRPGFVLSSVLKDDDSSLKPI